MDDHMKDSKKSPMYQFRLLIAEIENDKALQLKKILTLCGLVLLLL